MPLLPEVVASALDNTKSCLPWQRSHDMRARDRQQLRQSIDSEDLPGSDCADSRALGH
jgi:hypothetical protein